LRGSSEDTTDRVCTDLSQTASKKNGHFAVATLKNGLFKPGLKNYSYSVNLSCDVLEIMLFIIPYIPTNNTDPSPIENDSGFVSTTSLNKL
jgi:hypothetical protein